jgi:hypothetical protein
LIEQGVFPPQAQSIKMIEAGMQSDAPPKVRGNSLHLFGVLLVEQASQNRPILQLPPRVQTRLASVALQCLESAEPGSVLESDAAASFGLLAGFYGTQLSAKAIPLMLERNTNRVDTAIAFGCAGSDAFREAVVKELLSKKYPASAKVARKLLASARDIGPMRKKALQEIANGSGGLSVAPDSDQGYLKTRMMAALTAIPTALGVTGLGVKQCAASRRMKEQARQKANNDLLAQFTAIQLPPGVKADNPDWQALQDMTTELRTAIQTKHFDSRIDRDKSLYLLRLAKFQSGLAQASAAAQATRQAERDAAMQAEATQAQATAARENEQLSAIGELRRVAGLDAPKKTKVQQHNAAELQRLTRAVRDQAAELEYWARTEFGKGRLIALYNDGTLGNNLRSDKEFESMQRQIRTTLSQIDDLK